MPVRVNTRFVLLLFAVLVLLVGGLAAFYFAFVRSTPEENRRQAETFFAQGEYDRAVQYLGKAVQKRSNDVEMLYRFAEMIRIAEVDSPADARDRLKQIIDVHRSAVEARPEDPELLDRLYRLLYDLATKERMGEFYLRWIGELAQVKLGTVTQGPVADVARRYRGISLASQLEPESSAQNRERAFEDLQHALEVNPDDHLAAHYLARWSLVEADRIEGQGADDQTLQELRETAYELSKQTVADAEAPRRLERFTLHAELLGEEDLPSDAQERADKIAELESHLREQGEPRWLFIEVARQLYDLQRQNLAADLENQDAESLPELRRAIALLERGSERFPQDATIHRLRGQFHLLLQHNDEAIEAFRTAVEIEEAGRPLKVLRASGAEDASRIALGKLLLARAREAESLEARQALYERVERHVEAVKQANAANPAATLLEGRLLLTRGENQQALATLDRASRAYNHQNPEALRLLASASERLQQWGNTREQLERLLQLTPNSPNPWLALAEAQLRGQDLEAARESVERAEALAPENPRLPLLQARIAAAAGDASLALERLESLDAELQEAASDLRIELYRRTGQMDQARELALQRFENDPSDTGRLRLALQAVQDREGRAALLDRAEEAGATPAAINLLREQLIEGRSPDIQEITEQAVAQIEDPLDRRVAEGRLALAQGALEEAGQAADEVLEDSPGHAGAIRLAFRVALANEAYDEAEILADRAGQHNVDYADGHFFDGRLAAARDQWKDAEVAFQRGLSVRPVYSRGWTMLGQARMQNGDHSAAVTAFERAIEQKPDNTEARLSLAQAYDRLFEPDRALAALEQARRFAPRNEKVFRALADYYATQGRFDEAIELRRWWADRRPGDAGNRRALAVLLAANDSGEEALREVRSLIDEQGMTRPLASLLAQVHRRIGNPDRGLEVLTGYIAELGDEASAEDHRAVGRYLAAIGRIDEALGRFRTAVEMAEASRPGDTAMLRELGDTLFSSGRFAEAAEVYRRIHEAEPDDQTTRLRLAETLVRLNRGEEASELLEAVPEQGSSLVLQAMAAQQAGDQQEARRFLDRALQENPENRQALMMRAQLAAGVGEYERAISDANSVLSLAPDNATARNLLANLHAASGNFTAAAREYESLLARSPNSDELRGRLVRVLLRSGRRGEAMRVARQGLELNPSSLQWARSVGELATALNRLEVARDAWERVAAQDPRITDLFQYARVLLRLNRSAEVLSLLEKHPMALGDSPRLQALRARALFDTGERGSAQQVIRRALERSRDASAMSFVAQTASEILGPAATIEHMRTLPEGSTAGMRIAMGQVAARSGRWSQAADHFAEALNNVPTDAESVRLSTLSQLATALHQAGEHERAAERYQQYLDQRPNNPQMLNNFAFLLASDLDEAERALPLAERAVEVSGASATVLDTLGWVQHQLGRNTEALATLRRSADLQPLPANQYHLGRVLAAEGRQQEARDAFERAIELAEAAQDTDTRDKARAQLNRLAQPASRTE